MFEVKEEKKKRAVLLAVDTGSHDVDLSLKELEELFAGCGGETAALMVQKKDKPDADTYVGRGKLEEVKEYIAAYDVDLVICDDELTAAQFRTLEQILDIQVLDRTTVILDIFAKRAVSKEGAVQVELAQQKYRLPRLIGMGKTLSRLGGGIGTRGPGESKLETDRRHIMRRIRFLESELEQIHQQRRRTIKRRKKNEIPVVALAGYTNAGKSTLLNTVTGSDVFSADQLFATLDPTTRRFTLPEGSEAVMIDTVGFLQRIPHHLIEAFKSTLQHLADADIILVVLDASDPNCDIHREVTLQMLTELGCTEVPQITVYNKIDRNPELAKNKRPDTVFVSAKTGEGLDNLLELICKELSLYTVECEFSIPYSDGKTANILEREAIHCEISYEADGTHIKAEVRRKIFDQYQKYAIDF